MSSPERTVQLEQVVHLEKFAESFSRLGDDCVLSHITPGTPAIRALDAPMRIDGMTILLCRHGSLHVQINLCDYDIKAGDLLVISPDTLTRTSKIDYANTDAYIIFVSTRFLHDINIDLKTINIRSLVEHHAPVINLTDGEVDLLVRYYTLLEHTALVNEPNIFTHSIARSLMSAIIYELMQLNFSRLSAAKDTNDSLSRQNQYVHNFLSLLHIHYNRERSVAYYAEKLCISPKYLTVLVKEATGRSASAWINSFVLIEAKNLLRYSGKNVQQVAYALNFASQSAFGKFFKHLTGMSPSEYLKS